jgi:hypothetical protein
VRATAALLTVGLVVAPLQHSIQPRQGYVLADDDIRTDYYRAVTFNCSGAR